MKLLVAALALLTAVTTVTAYKCYLCVATDSQPCSRKMDCDNNVFERCFKSNVLGLVTQGCMKRELCIPPINCCEGDLCNAAPLTLPPLLLLGLSVCITLYLNLE